ncbi:MAG: DUF86 domain-containing protein [Chloroflexi bacterium]|nr:DUF86 domain-containing protein [Chloroflexota bacterium]
MLDLLEYTRKIAEFTREGRTAFFADEKTQLAVIRAYEVIGEIAKRLPDGLLQQQPHIEWKQIKGFRDFLAHNYETMILNIVWDAAEKLGELQRAGQRILDTLPQDDTEDTAE